LHGSCSPYDQPLCGQQRIKHRPITKIGPANLLHPRKTRQQRIAQATVIFPVWSVLIARYLLRLQVPRQRLVATAGQEAAIPSDGMA
jgi:hypothetical protein